MTLCHADGMEPVHLLLLSGGAVVVFVVLWLALARPRKRSALPYTQRQSLLTVGALRFYRVLLQAVPPGIAVFVKVRLMDVVSVPDKHCR